MGRINLGRVLLGGLLAGLLFNVVEATAGAVITGRLYEDAMRSLGKTMPATPGAMVYYLALGFVFGIAVVWLYAAIRPRFGPGPKTAVIAGLVMWFFTGLIDSLAEGPMGFFPVQYHVAMNVSWLIELPLCALAGAWVYQEE